LEKFGGTLIQRIFFKKVLGKSLYCNKNDFSPKRTVKVRKNKSAAHLEGACVPGRIG